MSRLGWSSYWITGAGSGIGRALAVQLAGPQRRLVLSGRRKSALEDVARVCRDSGAEVEVLPFDLVDEDERIRAVDHLAESKRLPEVLINNAGVSQRSSAVNTSWEVHRTIMDVNFTAAVHLTKMVLPHLITGNNGCVLTVSSIAGLLTSPLRSTYNAAKAAQISYFRTLRNELYRTGVLVSVALPGFVRTDVSRNALQGDGSRYGTLDPNQAGGISPEQAAAEIIAGLSRQRGIIRTGIPLKGRIILLLERLVPALADVILRSAEVR